MPLEGGNAEPNGTQIDLHKCKPGMIGSDPVEAVWNTMATARTYAIDYLQAAMNEINSIRKHLGLQEL